MVTRYPKNFKYRNFSNLPEGPTAPTVTLHHYPVIRLRTETLVAKGDCEGQTTRVRYRMARQLNSRRPLGKTQSSLEGDDDYASSVVSYLLIRTGFCFLATSVIRKHIIYYYHTHCTILSSIITCNDYNNNISNIGCTFPGWGMSNNDNIL